MNKLFIHNPWFRFIAPLCSGLLVYLLILLVNNNVEQLQEEFLGQELYVCIGLAYIIQEYSRISLFIFERIKWKGSLVWKIILQLIISVIVCMLLVSGSMYMYFTWVLGFTPNISELIIFNSIFSVVTIIYLSLYLSHQFLHKINSEIMTRELSIKEGVERDFLQFKKGINPILMFESLESLIILMKKNADEAELFVDHFSAVYRYILSAKMKELVPLDEELGALEELLLLFRYLPYRKIQLKRIETIATFVAPGSILSLAEQIIRSTIVSDDQELVLEIFQDNEHVCIKYPYQEKITKTLDLNTITDVIHLYRFYTKREIVISSDEVYKIIQIPKLDIQEMNHMAVDEENIL